MRAVAIAVDVGDARSWTGSKHGKGDFKVIHGDGRPPVLFFGHGTPLNAISDNQYTRAWTRVGSASGRPAGIVCISAHWFTNGCYVTAMEQPPTLYDFGYQNLFHIKYPAPGDPNLAGRVMDAVSPVSVFADTNWGFDHGAWSVLSFAFPSADIPVVQLSVDGRKPAAFHLEMGRRLRRLRDEGVLLVASGNIVHNLRLTIRRDDAPAYPWAVRFDEIVRDRILARDWSALTHYEGLDAEARLAVPTPDHYLPLLYAVGASDASDRITFPVDGIDRGSMSMRSVAFGLSDV